MLRTFKLKMLGVIVIVAVVGLIMQSGSSSKQFVEPVLEYMMDNKYDVGAVLSRYVSIPGTEDLSDILPASGGMVLRKPCDFLDIERSYGWYWSSEEHQQKFSSGIYLKMEDDTAVKPILSGRVEEINGSGNQESVLIRHSSTLFSLYGGLKEVLVDQGSTVGEDAVIGKTGESFYFEVRGKDGPVNPQSIFK